MPKYKVGDKVKVESKGLDVRGETGVVRTVYNHPAFVYYLVDIPYKTGKRVVCVGEKSMEIVDA